MSSGESMGAGLLCTAAILVGYGYTPSIDGSRSKEGGYLDQLFDSVIALPYALLPCVQYNTSYYISTRPWVDFAQTE